MSSNRIVTDEVIRKIRNLWKVGFTAKQIAERIGTIKPSTVYNYVGKKPYKTGSEK